MARVLLGKSTTSISSPSGMVFTGGSAARLGIAAQPIVTHTIAASSLNMSGLLIVLEVEHQLGE
jgi:hypothetical protein